MHRATRDRPAPGPASFAILVVAAISTAQAGGRDAAGGDSTAPARAADSAASTSFEARVENVSRALLGAPYRLGPLGEGAPPDEDPRFRLDVFDCTTYVETVLALALAGQDAVAAAEEPTLPWLDRVRYAGGAPTYAARRHLVDAQWIPQLVAEGLVRDITRSIGGRSTRTEELRLRRSSWERSRLARSLALPWSALPAGRHQLPYLPWSALEEDAVVGALPDLAVLNLVAVPERDTPTLVTHQALLLRGADGAPAVRHASTQRQRVVEEPLGAFAGRSRARRSREVLGVNVLAVEPGPAWRAEP